MKEQFELMLEISISVCNKYKTTPVNMHCYVPFIALYQSGNKRFPSLKEIINDADAPKKRLRTMITHSEYVTTKHFIFIII